MQSLINLILKLNSWRAMVMNSVQFAYRKETWLSSDPDTSLFKIDRYNLISQGKMCWNAEIWVCMIIIFGVVIWFDFYAFAYNMIWFVCFSNVFGRARKCFEIDLHADFKLSQCFRTSNGRDTNSTTLCMACCRLANQEICSHGSIAGGTETGSTWGPWEEWEESGTIQELQELPKINVSFTQRL